MNVYCKIISVFCVLILGLTGAPYVLSANEKVRGAKSRFGQAVELKNGRIIKYVEVIDSGNSIAVSNDKGETEVLEKNQVSKIYTLGGERQERRYIDIEDPVGPPDAGGRAIRSAFFPGWGQYALNPGTSRCYDASLPVWIPAFIAMGVYSVFRKEQENYRAVRSQTELLRAGMAISADAQNDPRFYILSYPLVSGVRRPLRKSLRQRERVVGIFSVLALGAYVFQIYGAYTDVPKGEGDTKRKTGARMFDELAEGLILDGAYNPVQNSSFAGEGITKDSFRLKLGYRLRF